MGSEAPGGCPGLAMEPGTHVLEKSQSNADPISSGKPTCTAQPTLGEFRSSPQLDLYCGTTGRTACALRAVQPNPCKTPVQSSCRAPPGSSTLQELCWEHHPSPPASPMGQEIPLHLSPICSSTCISAVQTRWSHLLFLTPFLPRLHPHMKLGQRKGATQHAPTAHSTAPLHSAPSLPNTSCPPPTAPPSQGQTPTSHPHQPQLLGQIQSLPVSAAKRELSRHAELTATIPPTSLSTQLSITPRNAPFCPMAAPVPTSRKGTAPILADLIFSLPHSQSSIGKQQCHFLPAEYPGRLHPTQGLLLSIRLSPGADSVPEAHSVLPRTISTLKRKKNKRKTPFFFFLSFKLLRAEPKTRAFAVGKGAGCNTELGGDGATSKLCNAIRGTTVKPLGKPTVTQ